MLCTDRTEIAGWSALLCEVLKKQLFPFERRQQRSTLLHPRGLLQRAAEREPVTERTIMRSDTDEQPSNPQRCRHRACRRSGKCHGRRACLCASAIAASEAAPAPAQAPRRRLSDAEWNARLDLIDADARLLTSLAKLLNKFEGRPRTGPRIRWP
jgi:hypothetical protein